jgi:hypothetical protein
MKLLTKEVFIPETNGRSVFPGFITYISKTEPVLMHRFGWLDASDTFDDFHDSFSYDNGRTWTEPVLRLKSREVPEGRIRYAENAVYFDADTGKVITATSKGLYPQDKHTADTVWRAEFNQYDPATKQWRHLFESDFGYREGTQMSFSFPIKTSKGRLLFPAFRPMVDAAGRPVHHLGHFSAVRLVFQCIGEYQADGSLTWHAGGLAQVDPDISCRGICENTLIELKDGRIAMVARGDNGAFPEKPGYKWVCFSRDDGETWSTSAPLGCTEGDPIESPATGSAIFRSIKNGKVYWMGNLAMNGERAKGNWPRSPLVIAEIQEEPFALKRDTITVIDQRGPGDSPKVQMSNFRYYQDRQTGDVVVFLSRYAERDAEKWKLANYYRYRVEL